MKKTLLLLTTAGAMGALSAPAAAQSVTYENTVKKIFAERCAACHISGAPSMSEFQNNKEAWTKKFKGPSLADYKSVMVMVNVSEAAGSLERLEPLESGFRRVDGPRRKSDQSEVRTEVRVRRLESGENERDFLDPGVGWTEPTVAHPRWRRPTPVPDIRFDPAAEDAVGVHPPVAVPVVQHRVGLVEAR